MHPLGPGLVVDDEAHLTIGHRRQDLGSQHIDKLPHHRPDLCLNLLHRIAIHRSRLRQQILLIVGPAHVAPRHKIVKLRGINLGTEDQRRQRGAARMFEHVETLRPVERQILRPVPDIPLVTIIPEEGVGHHRSRHRQTLLIAGGDLFQIFPGLDSRLLRQVGRIGQGVAELGQLFDVGGGRSNHPGERFAHVEDAGNGPVLVFTQRRKRRGGHHTAACVQRTLVDYQFVEMVDRIAKRQNHPVADEPNSDDDVERLKLGEHLVGVLVRNALHLLPQHLPPRHL